MNYKEQLLDPRWQRRRLEILQRDEFTCQKCLSKDKTLHVHHTQYFKGKMAWEYENCYLKTLCLDCHELEELLKKQKKNLLNNFKLEGYGIDFPCPVCGNDDIMILNVDHVRCTVCDYTCGIVSPSDIEKIKQSNKKHKEYLSCQE